MPRQANGLPEDLREHARLMCDIIAIAFQTDKTRVATLLLARDLSAMYYPFLEVREGHHAASHNNASAGYERIDAVMPHRPFVPAGAPGELRLEATKDEVIPAYPY